MVDVADCDLFIPTLSAADDDCDLQSSKMEKLILTLLPRPSSSPRPSSIARLPMALEDQLATPTQLDCVPPMGALDDNTFSVNNGELMEGVPDFPDLEDVCSTDSDSDHVCGSSDDSYLSHAHSVVQLSPRLPSTINLRDNFSGVFDL